MTPTVTLYRGDCLEVMRDLPAGSVDAVVTDPPYGIGYQSARRTDKDARFPVICGDDVPPTEWAHAAFRIARSTACLLCFCRWDTSETFKDALKGAGWVVRSQGVWDRMSHGLGNLRAQLAPQHDLMWFATKGDYGFPGHRPKSVYRAMRLSGQRLVHPTQKPLALMRQIVEDLVPVSGMVLDPFAGSFTTGVACIQRGRSFIGIEIDPHYFTIGEKRIRDALASCGMTDTDISGCQGHLPLPLLQTHEKAECDVQG